MRKYLSPLGTISTIFILAALLGVQTVRLHRLKSNDVEMTLALSDASPDTGEKEKTSGPSEVGTANDRAVSRQRIIAPRRATPSKDKEVAGEPAVAVPLGDSVSLGKEQILAQAKMYMDAADSESAEALLTQAIADDPDNARFYRERLSELYRTAGNVPEEERLYNDWISENARDPEPHLRLANLYNQLGQRDKALAEVARYQELGASNPELLSSAAALFREMDMELEEGAALEAWVEKSPGSLDAQRALGEFYRRTHDEDAAVAVYQAAVEQYPGNAELHLELARTYERLGQDEQTLAEFDAALALKPGDPRVLMPLGDHYRRMGDLDTALQMFQAVIDAHPGSREAERAADHIERINDPLPPPPAPKTAKL